MVIHKPWRDRPWTALAAAVAALALLVGAAFTLTPFAYAELWMRHLVDGPPPSDPAAFLARPGPAAGEVIDGRWRVQAIAPGTWAIGEPQGDPDNYEYLLVGEKRALLIDAGSSDRDIRPVLTRLTRLPVTVLPTHLHFDHVNGLKHFASIALVDLPQTRRLLKDGTVRLGRYQYMGLKPPSFRVSEWIAPGSMIDLGGRRLTLLSTPGHTASSVSIHDPAAKLLFTGDFIYPTTLYAFMPDTSLSAYQATAERLLRTLPTGTRLYGAHCCRNDVSAAAPWLDLGDLRDVRDAVAAIRAGKAHGRGLVIRRFPVNRRMTLLTLYPFGDR